MTVTQIYQRARKLAKSHEYQSLYSGAKEFGFHLFKNLDDLTDLQLVFLSFLNFYATLFMDIYLKEVSEKVLEKDIYEDAYMCYKNKKQKEPLSQAPKDMPNQPFEKESRVKSQWHFNRRH